MTPIIYVSFLCTILDMGQGLSPDGPYIYAASYVPLCMVMYTDYCGVLLLHIRVCRCLHTYQLAASNYTFCYKTCSTFN